MAKHITEALMRKNGRAIGKRSRRPWTILYLCVTVAAMVSVSFWLRSCVQVRKHQRFVDQHGILALYDKGLQCLPRWAARSADRVTEARLFGNKFEVLPPELQTFRSLRRLEVNNNLITALPEWLWDLKELRYLDISGNLVAKLPRGISHSALGCLVASDNKLQILPEDFASAPYLQVVILNRNPFEHFPPTLCCRNLKRLDMLETGLTELPDSVAEMENLVTLDLRKNLLEELPEAMGELHHLESLDLGENRLQSLPQSMAKLHGLKILRLAQNRFQEMPGWISELKGLEELHLGGNTALSALPRGLASLPELKTLNVFGCAIPKDALERLSASAPDLHIIVERF